MQNVPKIVQVRLQRPMPDAAQTHPDADLLTAFAEQSLIESERGQVMEHLAHCGDCREVVALALPATDDVAMMKPARAARSGWLAWPAVRWGVVAAGVLLVTVVGVRQLKQHTQQNAALVSSSLQQEAKIVSPSQSPQLPAPVPAARAVGPFTGKIPKQTPMQKPSRARSEVLAEPPSTSLNTLAPPSRVVHGAVLPGGIGNGSGGGIGSGSGHPAKNYQGPTQRDSFAFPSESKEASRNPAGQLSTGASAQQTAIPPASEMVEVQTEAAQVATVQNQVELPAQNASAANLDVVKAKDSVPSQGAPSLPSPNVSVQNEPSLMLRASLRWTISSAGALQRSFDAGKTWQDVNVQEAASAGKSFPISRSQVAGVADYKYKATNSKRADEGQPAPIPVFRAVAALGSEVWAGGSSAVLYHSADAGAHWTKVQPSQPDAILTGDVTSIQFSDASNGAVITSNAERWITNDAGETWHKQP